MGHFFVISHCGWLLWNLWSLPKCIFFSLIIWYISIIFFSFFILLSIKIRLLSLSSKTVILFLFSLTLVLTELRLLLVFICCLRLIWVETWIFDQFEYFWFLTLERNLFILLVIIVFLLIILILLVLFIWLLLFLTKFWIILIDFMKRMLLFNLLVNKTDSRIA